mmetsp:Transcript_151141/g.263415  ORF Transcript_151141/g.263415 Transcript_151141/m.263415 type:complete len:358 (-) Transcript_151141:122-1195(-)
MDQLSRTPLWTNSIGCCREITGTSNRHLSVSCVCGECVCGEVGDAGSETGAARSEFSLELPREGGSMRGVTPIMLAAVTGRLRWSGVGLPDVRGRLSYNGALPDVRGRPSWCGAAPSFGGDGCECCGGVLPGRTASSSCLDTAQGCSAVSKTSVLSERLLVPERALWQTGFSASLGTWDSVDSASSASGPNPEDQTRSLDFLSGEALARPSPASPPRPLFVSLANAAPPVCKSHNLFSKLSNCSTTSACREASKACMELISFCTSAASASSSAKSCACCVIRPSGSFMSLSLRPISLSVGPSGTSRDFCCAICCFCCLTNVEVLAEHLMLPPEPLLMTPLCTGVPGERSLPLLSEKD